MLLSMRRNSVADSGGPAEPSPALNLLKKQPKSRALSSYTPARPPLAPFRRYTSLNERQCGCTATKSRLRTPKPLPFAEFRHFLPVANPARNNGTPPEPAPVAGHFHRRSYIPLN